MIFGFDFDNTLINYDNIFFTQAFKKKLIKAHSKKNKNSIKNTILKKFNITEWQKLQSTVYSKEINQAKPNKKLISILKLLGKNKIKFYIISHKTKFPYYGRKINLHKISNNWLNKKIFNKKNNIKRCRCYFETTLEKKIERIKKTQVTHFVDDLQEVLKKIPNSIVKILYQKNSFNINKIKNIIHKNKILN